MIIFLYGPDTYRASQKLKEITEHYQQVHKSGLNLKYFQGEQFNFQDFNCQIQSSSMFGEKKMIILKSIIGNKDSQENFLKNKKKFIDSKDIILFFETRTIPANNLLFKFLKKYGEFQEFKLLEGWALKNWIKKEFRNYGTEVGPGVLEKLVDFVGNDLWQMENEIKKLVSFRKGKKIINSGDEELLVKPKIDADIFKTIDAIAQKDKKQAVELVHKHLAKGDSPLYLLAMINFQFRNLLTMKSYESRHEFNTNYSNIRIISGELGIHPFVVKKSLWQTKKFSYEELKKIYRRLLKVDLNIKTGQVNPETALDLLITEI